MTAPQSLADQAVDTLAAVRAMDQGLDLTHPERHAIRNLKRIAEQIVGDALRQARDLAWQAEDIRKMVSKARSTPADTPETPA